MGATTYSVWVARVDAWIAEHYYDTGTPGLRSCRRCGVLVRGTATHARTMHGDQL